MAEQFDDFTTEKQCDELDSSYWEWRQQEALREAEEIDDEDLIAAAEVMDNVEANTCANCGYYFNYEKQPQYCASCGQKFSPISQPDKERVDAYFNARHDWKAGEGPHPF